MPAANLDAANLDQVLRAEYESLRPSEDFSANSSQELFTKVHGQKQPLSALCISGGGIRSATFALGIIQSLSDHGLLSKFDYLSTVSGGGYVGSWLTAWIKRAGGLAAIEPCLRRDGGAAGADSDPVQHLREYNNYLSPKLGFFSGDSWTLAATVLRNIFLNWLVLVPLLLFALMIPRLLLTLARLGETFRELYGTADPIANSFAVKYALPFIACFMLALAFYNAARYLPGAGNVDHSQEDYMRWVLAPLILADLGFCAFDSLYFLDSQNRATTPLEVILWTILPAFAGCITFVVTCGAETRKRARDLYFPLFAAMALMSVCAGSMEWFITNTVLSDATYAQYVSFGPPLVLLSFDIGSWIFVGLSSRVLRDEDREWLARSSAWTELFCVTWIIVSVLVLVAPTWAMGWKTWAKSALAAAGVISSIVTTLTGRVGDRKEDRAGTETKSSGVTSFALKLAPLVFIATFIIGLSLLTDIALYKAHLIFPSIDRVTNTSRSVHWSEHNFVLRHTGWSVVTTLGALFLAFGWIMARFINVNTFSLQGMYRNRLIRAYLGASNPRRNASRFTGFSDSDNISMHELRGQRPLHVLNMSLNLVAGKRLAWQQRKAQPFTVSPFYSGNYQLGYRDSKQYGSADAGISLGTAVTISGAAASPNMGYYSSAAVGFIMTLFNARLGSWLGNPGVAGEKSWKQSGPTSAVQSFVREALGLTTNVSPYVYLSDGGHFENLALYEMVLRRCRHIVVLDGASDPDLQLNDLGNAMRKIRIDMGIPIDFEHGVNMKEKRYAVGTIRYSAVDGACEDGVLIYIKAVKIGTEPVDVASYAAANPEFPNESTANQWFTESQTESYRMLGLHTIDEMCAGWVAGSLAEFSQHLRAVNLSPQALLPRVP